MPEKVRELDALIDRFLRETDALVPVPNPNYNAAAAAMGRWVAKNCRFAVRDGVLRIEPTSSSAFVATASLKIAGPVVASYRVKCPAGGTGKMQWRTAGQEKFPAQGQIASFDVPAASEWREVRVELPVDGTLIHLRLYPGVAHGEVQIDWIQLSGAGGTVVARWDFDEPE